VLGAVDRAPGSSGVTLASDPNAMPTPRSARPRKGLVHRAGRSRAVRRTCPDRHPNAPRTPAVPRSPAPDRRCRRAVPVGAPRRVRCGAGRDGPRRGYRPARRAVRPRASSARPVGSRRPRWRAPQSAARPRASWNQAVSVSSSSSRWPTGLTGDRCRAPQRRRVCDQRAVEEEVPPTCRRSRSSAVDVEPRPSTGPPRSATPPRATGRSPRGP
jgi:hypothetical protein